DVLLAERTTRRKAPLADFEIVRRLAEDARGPVFIARRDLAAAADFGAHERHAGDFALDRFGVVDAQRPGKSRAAADASAREAAGPDENHVLSETRDLRLDLRLGAVADADHRDDGADADDHAEHGQDRAEFVPLEGAEGDF